MSRPIMVLNGPNLNLLGEREPHIYGTTTLSAVEDTCQAICTLLGRGLEFHQSNHEGAVIDLIHQARKTCDALVINPAGLSFGSVPLIDAVKTFEGPVIEIHISNIHARDEHHRHSLISHAATGVICGLGTWGYVAAVLAAARALGPLPDTLPPAIASGPI